MSESGNGSDGPSKPKPAYRPLDYLDHGVLSPSGKCSKRNRKFLQDKLARQLWPDGLTREQLYGPDIEVSEKERLLNQAKRLRELAERGMSRRKFTKEAERLERLAADLKD